MKYLGEILAGLWSLVVGMGVTLRYMLKRPVTVLYPHEEIATSRFKGPIAFTTDELDGSHRCIACNACIKACPSRCMALEVEKNAQGQRVLTQFKVDYTLCSLCGICIEVCPTEALMHDSANYDMTAVTRAEMVNDLLKPFRDRGVDLARPILTPAQKKALYSQKSSEEKQPT
jgi:NADH-quinone oxidoreductase subunit I